MDLCVKSGFLPAVCEHLSPVASVVCACGQWSAHLVPEDPARGDWLRSSHHYLLLDLAESEPPDEGIDTSPAKTAWKALSIISELFMLSPIPQ